MNDAQDQMPAETHMRPEMRSRHGATLYFFPALLPLIDLLPWLLTAVGALAGATQFLKSAFWRRRGPMIVTGVALVAFLCVAGYRKLPAYRLHGQGTILTQTAALPQAMHYATPANETIVLPPVFGKIWQRALPHDYLSPITFAGDLILLGSNSGTLDAFSVYDGRLLWSVPGRQQIFSAVTAGNGIGYFGEGLHDSSASAMTAVRLKDGRPVWQRIFKGHLEAQPALSADGKRLWLGAGQDGLWCLDAVTGNVVWHDALGHIDATPLLHDDAVYVPVWTNPKVEGMTLFAVSAKDGAVRWRAALPGGMMGSAQMGPGGMMVVATAIGQIGPIQKTDKGWASAVSAEGKILWSRPLPGMPIPEGVVSQKSGLAFFALKNGMVTALRLRDGVNAWEMRAGDEVRAPVTVYEATDPPLVFTWTFGGTMDVRNAATGAPVRTIGMPRGGYVPAGIYKDVLYITGPDMIAAYGPVSLLVGMK
jgi:outer membrane protein assembly factor BamB